MMVTAAKVHKWRNSSYVECGRRNSNYVRSSTVDINVTCKTCLSGHINSPLQNEAYIMSRMLGNVEMARRCLLSVSKHLNMTSTVAYETMCDSLKRYIREQYEAKKMELKK